LGLSSRPAKACILYVFGLWRNAEDDFKDKQDGLVYLILSPKYKRAYRKGGTLFFTLVTYRRRKFIATPKYRQILRNGIDFVPQKRPFTMDAWALLPDHLHCIRTLPSNDADYSTR
jgi:hypothetical protein